MSDKCEVNRRAKERKEQGLDAMNYINEQKVAQTMQTLLNQMIIDKPDDVNGYMARALTSLALAPSIHHFEVDHTIDANCDPATKVSLFAKIKGECEMIAESTVSENFSRDDTTEENLKTNLTTSKSAITAGEPMEQSPNSLDANVPLVSKEKLSTDDMTQQINTLLEGKQLSNIEECLDSLSECSIERFKPSLMLAVSQSLISGLSNSTQLPLYKVISMLNLGDTPPPQSDFTLPLPMYHILSGTGGKCKLADYYISISPNIATLDSLKYAQLLFDKLRQSVKMASPPMTDGAIRHNIDKLEQGYDLISEAGKGLELSLGEDVFVILNADADKRWDCDKNKYEVASGQWKSSSELTEYYNEATRTHSNLVIGLINPFHEQDHSGYSIYSKNHPSIVLFVNNKNTIEKVRENLKAESEAENGGTGNFVLSKQLEMPLNEWISGAKSRDNEDMKGLGFAIKHQANAETQSRFPVDLVTGVNGSFMQVGSPRDKGTSLSITRLLEIEELRKDNKLKVNSHLAQLFASNKK